MHFEAIYQRQQRSTKTKNFHFNDLTLKANINKTPFVLGNIQLSSPVNQMEIYIKMEMDAIGKLEKLFQNWKTCVERNEGGKSDEI